MTEQPSNNTALITGGSAGIGLATAKLLVQEGFDVAVCGRNPERLAMAMDAISDAANGSCNVVTIRCDLSEHGAAKGLAAAALERLGSINVLVNNAAVAPLCAIEEASDDVFDETVRVNLRGPFVLTRELWPALKSGGAGVVINVSSLAAVDPFPGFGLYGASKAWLDLMTTALAREGEPHNIRVYSIRPGAVETELLRGLFPEFPADQCVTPDEVALQIIRCIHGGDEVPSGSHLEVKRQPA